ncbi:uncharacterized protein LOC130425561 [Triplophysa dalaica]|uniref:uncharacterized protein LOC130425561 n=1 Tax=Triplophysa dalaica TaxID=1582913 RepID=UPI0024DFC237|nr:uncharacterized protein LOC130425561 [Triplophysa dalaica]XP_056607779.1 uncharacterized protein LOC130425561 [Triplophysa dalaica]
MTQSQFRRFRPVSSIAEQLDTGVATLHPQPPPERSSDPDRRDFGNIGYPLQYVHMGLGPNPQTRRIPFRSTTVPDDTWNRLWAQCVKRHTGVVLPPLSQSKKPRMPPQKTPWAARPNKSAWEKQHLLYYNGEEHQTAQQYTADIRERARKDVADLHKEGVSQRKEIEINDRRRKNWEHEEEVKKWMETHNILISSMESASASIQTVEAESQSVVFALREKDNDLRTLNGKIEDLEIEVEILQEGYKKIDEYTGLLELVPPELWETVMRNIKDIQIKAKGFELLLETDLEYTELCLHEERGKMLLLKSIQDKMASLAMQQKIISRIIMTRKEIIERLKLEVCIISQQKEEHNKRLKMFKGKLESLRGSLKALKKRDMDLVKTITAYG